MNGYQRRTEAKKRQILTSAQELFGRHGFKKVSLDEIAECADVSKVSIYSYFQNKDGLVHALVREAFTERKKSIEALIHGEAPFLEKLQNLILQKSDTSMGYSKEFLKEMFAHPAWREQPTGDIEALMEEFFDQGKKEGHIDPTLSNEALLLYVEVFKSGTEANSETLAALGQDGIKQIITMFFRGFTS